MKVEIVKEQSIDRFAGICDLIDKRYSFAVVCESTIEAEKFLKILEDDTEIQWQGGEKPTEYVPASKPPFSIHCSFGERLSHSSYVSKGENTFYVKDLI